MKKNSHATQMKENVTKKLHVKKDKKVPETISNTDQKNNDDISSEPLEDRAAVLRRLVFLGHGNTEEGDLGGGIITYW